MRISLRKILIVVTSLIPYIQTAHIHGTRQASNISWFTCPDVESTQCAFLDVPMDYTDTTNNATVSIFLRRVPANVTTEQRLGSILVNPGGPGGSGSDYVALAGQVLSTLVEGRYDIIGFDPRGVNLTIPSTACFGTEAKFLHRDYQIQLLGAPFPHIGGVGEHSQVAQLSALQAGHNAACIQNGNHQMLRSIGTVAVAQDMARIVEALGEDGLNYWGYSYGTILGATFAALRPDLVKRMVLDGVSDSEMYYKDVLEWTRDGVRDSDKTLTGFFSTCIDAGPQYCAFAVPRNGSNQPETVDSLRKRLNDLYARFGVEPLVIPDSVQGLGVGSGIIRATDLQFLILEILYSPITWRDVAEVLVQLEHGNGSLPYTVLYQTFTDIHPQPYNHNVFNRSMQKFFTSESFNSILCSDTSPVNMSVDEYTNYIRQMGNVAQVGEQWALNSGGCLGWSFQANQRYTGPWTTENGLKKTRFPILFVSLDSDPVTPLSSAAKMSRGFGIESATLLIQQGYGHTSTAQPSLCTSKNVRDYFIDGKVPENGTYCTPELGFIYPNNSTMKRSLSKRDEGILGAIISLHKAKSKKSLPAFGYQP